MNYTARDDHVPEAGRNNRVIAERIRATYHKLPYKTMPKIMWRYLAMVVTQQLNYFPVKGGISDYYSPHMILQKKTLDYNKHCQVEFGEYVQACNEPNPTNSQAPRTIDAIYLRPMNNLQGGHELMDLNSGRLITRRKVTPIPVTPSVIELVNTMGKSQKMPILKFTNRHGIPLLPADWIAGVEYTHENDKSEEDEECDEA